MVNAPFSAERVLGLSALAGPQPDLFEAAEAAPMELVVLKEIQELPPGGLLVLDFGGIRVSSESARQLLRRVLHRLRSGELEDRFLVLSALRGSRYNVQVMLQGEDLVAVERLAESPGARLIGRPESALQQTFAALLARPVATASEIRDVLGLNSTQAATNRLSALVKAGGARRIAEQSLEGGGREFVFAAVQ